MVYHHNTRILHIVASRTKLVIGRGGKLGRDRVLSLPLVNIKY